MSYTFVLVVRKKYVNGFYPSAGNVLTSEMYLVNANFGSNSKDIEIGKKNVISLTFIQKFNFACRVIQKVNKSLFVDGTQIVRNNFHVVFPGRALISVLKTVYNLKKSVLLARHRYIITTITG